MKRNYPSLKESDLVTCRGCGYVDEAWYFGVKQKNKREGYTYPIYNQTCPLCQQIRGDEEKKKDRAKAKVRDMLIHKAKKFHVSVIALREEFGWPSVEELATVINNTHKGNCHYCQSAYEDFGHGLADISLDQRDPFITAPY